MTVLIGLLSIGVFFILGIMIKIFSMMRYTKSCAKKEQHLHGKLILIITDRLATRVSGTSELFSKVKTVVEVTIWDCQDSNFTAK